MIDFIFKVCLGQVVDKLRELQFWIESEIFCRIEASDSIAGPGIGPYLTGLGERGAFVRVHVLRGLRLMEV